MIEMFRLPLLCLSCLLLALNSCSLITTPVKIVGKATTTTIDVAGKAVEAGFNAVTSGDDDKDE